MNMNKKVTTNDSWKLVCLAYFLYNTWMKNVICQLCNRKGHVSRHCPRYKKQLRRDTRIAMQEINLNDFTPVYRNAKKRHRHIRRKRINRRKKNVTITHDKKNKKTGQLHKH